MGRAERVERAIKAATEMRLAARDQDRRRAARRLRRAEQLVLDEIGRSVPKRRAAAALGISVPALERWVRLGRLPVVRRPGGREEVDASALLDVLEEVRGLRDDEGVSRSAVAGALRNLALRGLPRERLRPNESARTLRESYARSSGVERLREAAELSAAATTLARYGARARADDAA